MHKRLHSIAVAVEYERYAVSAIEFAPETLAGNDRKPKYDRLHRDAVSCYILLSQKEHITLVKLEGTAFSRRPATLLEHFSRCPAESRQSFYVSISCPIKRRSKTRVYEEALQNDAVKRSVHLTPQYLSDSKGNPRLDQEDTWKPL